MDVVASVEYADPGFTGAGEPALPLGSAAEIVAAWAHVNSEANYSPDEAWRVRDAIRAAASRMRIDLDDDTEDDAPRINANLGDTVPSLPSHGRVTVAGAAAVPGRPQIGKAPEAGI
jgi:hypothetical protein